MSTPMCYCDWVRAAQGDEEVYGRMRDTLKKNVCIGHYTTFGCSHTPPCQATKEEIDTLNARLKKDVYDKLEEERNVAAKEFDKDGKLVAALYGAGAEYRSSFQKDVELCLDCCFPGFPGPGGEGAPEYRASILFYHIQMMTKCLARMCIAQKDFRLFVSLKEEIQKLEKDFGLAKEPDAEKS